MATVQKRQNADGATSYRAMMRKRGFQPLSEPFSSKTRAETANSGQSARPPG